MANTNPILTGQQLDNSNLVATIQRVLSSYKLDDDSCLPAIVISYDRANNVATVRPLIQIQDVTGAYRSRHPLTSINVLSLGAGGFHISFPMNEGDLGWIVAADRDLAVFKQELTESPPNSSSPRSFAYGIFVPDVMRKYSLNDEDANAMVIQSIDGATRISIRSDNIKITAPTKFIVDCPESEFTGDVTIDKNLIVTGTSTMTGAATFNGGLEGKAGTAVTLPATTTIDGITVASHGHEQQNNGSGRTAGGMEE